MNESDAISALHRLLGTSQLTDVKVLVFRLSWSGKTYTQIAEQSGYDDDYIRVVGFRLWRLLSKKLKTKVTKKNLRSVLQRYELETREKTLDTSLYASKSSNSKVYDWGEAVDTNVFYGRNQELNHLKQSILETKCRLVGIFGIGG
ncbi:MAG: hypothetical protein AAGF83_14410, partial [Cyanobacteria bacterium P01_G01_bin.67]